MKNFTLILSILLLTIFSGCQKEEIKPRQSSESTHCIEKSNNPNVNDNGEKTDGGENNTKGFGGFFKYSDTSDVITDPNRDEDEDRKVKKRS